MTDNEPIAPKIELLEFISLKETVTCGQLMAYFGYRYSTITKKIWRLTKERLVTTLMPEERPLRWILTDRGKDRLLYLKMKQHGVR